MERAEAEALRSLIVGSRAPRVAVLMQRVRLHLVAAHQVAAHLVAALTADIVRPFCCNSRAPSAVLTDSLIYWPLLFLTSRALASIPQLALADGGFARPRRPILGSIHGLGLLGREQMAAKPRR